jgi:hypothetical protein
LLFRHGVFNNFLILNSLLRNWLRIVPVAFAVVGTHQSVSLPYARVVEILDIDNDINMRMIQFSIANAFAN